MHETMRTELSRETTFRNCSSSRRCSLASPQVWLNAPAFALRWFTSDTAHFVFIHIASVVKPVHIFMARNKVSKSCLMAELCFYRFVLFSCVQIYMYIYIYIYIYMYIDR